MRPLRLGDGPRETDCTRGAEGSAGCAEKFGSAGGGAIVSKIAFHPGETVLVGGLGTPTRAARGATHPRGMGCCARSSRGFGAPQSAAFTPPARGVSRLRADPRWGRQNSEGPTGPSPSRGPGPRRRRASAASSWETWVLVVPRLDPGPREPFWPLGWGAAPPCSLTASKSRPTARSCWAWRSSPRASWTLARSRRVPFIWPSSMAQPVPRSSNP